jgi:hypothetical protein
MFASLSPSFYLRHYDENFLRHYYLSTVLYQERKWLMRSCDIVGVYLTSD